MDAAYHFQSRLHSQLLLCTRFMMPHTQCFGTVWFATYYCSSMVVVDCESVAFRMLACSQRAGHFRIAINSGSAKHSRLVLNATQKKDRKLSNCSWIKKSHTHTHTSCYWNTGLLLNDLACPIPFNANTHRGRQIQVWASVYRHHDWATRSNGAMCAK